MCSAWVRGALCMSISMLPGTEHCMSTRGSVRVYLYVTGYWTLHEYEGLCACLFLCYRVLNIAWVRGALCVSICMLPGTEHCMSTRGSVRVYFYVTGYWTLHECEGLCACLFVCYRVLNIAWLRGALCVSICMLPGTEHCMTARGSVRVYFYVTRYWTLHECEGLCACLFVCYRVLNIAWLRGALCMSICMLPGTEHCMSTRGSVHVYLYVTGYWTLHEYEGLCACLFVCYRVLNIAWVRGALCVSICMLPGTEHCMSARGSVRVYFYVTGYWTLHECEGLCACLFLCYRVLNIAWVRGAMCVSICMLPGTEHCMSARRSVRVYLYVTGYWTLHEYEGLCACLFVCYRVLNIAWVRGALCVSICMLPGTEHCMSARGSVRVYLYVTGCWTLHEYEGLCACLFVCYRVLNIAWLRGALCVSICMLPGTEHCMSARGSVRVYLYVTGYWKTTIGEDWYQKRQDMTEITQYFVKLPLLIILYPHVCLSLALCFYWELLSLINSCAFLQATLHDRRTWCDCWPLGGAAGGEHSGHPRSNPDAIAEGRASETRAPRLMFTVRQTPASLTREEETNTLVY